MRFLLLLDNSSPGTKAKTFKVWHVSRWPYEQGNYHRQSLASKAVSAFTRNRPRLILRRGAHFKLMAKYEKFSTIWGETSDWGQRYRSRNPNIRLASCERVRESQKCWIWDKYRHQPPRVEENPKGKKRPRVKWLLSPHDNSGWCRTVFVFLYTFAHRRLKLQLWDDHVTILWTQKGCLLCELDCRHVCIRCLLSLLNIKMFIGPVAWPCNAISRQIILRNKSQGGIIRVCMGILTIALRNKKIQSNSHTPSLSTRGSKTIYWCQVTVCSSARHSLQRRQG